jgi:hypothetical protein
METNQEEKMGDTDSVESADATHEEVATGTKLILRIHAANLPRHGILNSLPDTYAIVTSVSGRASLRRSGPDGFASASSVEWGRTEM